LIRSLLVWMTLWGCGIWSLFFVIESDTVPRVAGYASMGIVILMYGAPLSTVRKVLATRDSSSLYLPTCLVTIVCSSFWCIYGLAIDDFFIWSPNVAGISCSCLQLILIALLPNRTTRTVAPLPETENKVPSVGLIPADLEMGNIGPLSCVSDDVASLLANTGETEVKYFPLPSAVSPSPTKGIVDSDVNGASMAKPGSSVGAEIPKLGSFDDGPIGDTPSLLDPHRSKHAALPFVHAKAGVSTGATLECAVCLTDLTTPDKTVVLHCGHRFCPPCLRRCSEAEMKCCPTCRHPHELDPQVLKARLDAYREAYRNWRKGGAKGAKNEVDDISAIAVAKL